MQSSRQQQGSMLSAINAASLRQPVATSCSTRWHEHRAKHQRQRNAWLAPPADHAYNSVATTAWRQLSGVTRWIARHIWRLSKHGAAAPVLNAAARLIASRHPAASLLLTA